MSSSGFTVVPPDPASQAGPSKRDTTAPSRGKPRSRQEGKEVSRDFADPSFEDWKNQAPEVREKYYKQTEADFFEIVDSYRVDANLAIQRSWWAKQSSQRWRIGLIIATGVMTIINGFLALKPDLGNFWAAVMPALPVFAALYAGCLTIAQNVERSLKKAEDASTYRDQRELLLNQYREYSSKWVYYVEAFGETPIACRNAGLLYRELVDCDQTLRQQLRQLKSAAKTIDPGQS